MRRFALVFLGVLLLSATAWLLFSARDPSSRESRAASTDPEQPSVAARDVVDAHDRAAVTVESTDASNPEVSASPPRTVRVRTLDSRERPLAEVEVWELTDTSMRSRGTSNAQGELELSLVPQEWAALVGRRSGYGASRSSWRGEPPSEIVLRLVDGGFIAGRVTLADGRAAPEGLRVLAIPTRKELYSFGRTLADLESDPEVGRGWTDRDGVFRVEDLALDESYALHAGGRGYVVRGLPARATASASDAVITVSRAYGVLVEFAEPSGAPPCLREVYGARGTVHSFVRGASLVFGTPASASLALHDLLPSPAPNRQLFIVSSDRDDLEQIDTLHVDCELPGYLPFGADLVALPIESGLAVHRALLSPIGVGLGALKVDLSAYHSWIRASTSRIGALAMLEVRPRVGGESAYPVRGSEALSLEIPCLPAEVYRVKLSCEPEGVDSSLDLGEITVHEARTVELTAPAGEFGSLAIEILTDQGRVYVGEVRIGVGQRPVDLPDVDPRAVIGGEVAFRRAPYSFALLKPGSYRVWLAYAGASAPVEVVVRAGELATVTLELSEK